MHLPGCQKSGAFHIRIKKKRVGANHIPGGAEKGGHSARTSVLYHI